jgi:hypothetical protein
MVFTVGVKYDVLGVHVIKIYIGLVIEELNVLAVSALGVRSRKQSNIGRSSNGWPKIYYLELLRASKGT